MDSIGTTFSYEQKINISDGICWCPMEDLLLVHQWISGFPMEWSLVDSIRQTSSRQVQILILQSWTQGIDSNPAQMLVKLMTKMSLLLSTKSLLQLQPRVFFPEKEQRRLKDRQRQQRKFYDKLVRYLAPLKKDDSVRIKPSLRSKRSGSQTARKMGREKEGTCMLHNEYTWCITVKIKAICVVNNILKLTRSKAVIKLTSAPSRFPLYAFRLQSMHTITNVLLLKHREIAYPWRLQLKHKR